MGIYHAKQTRGRVLAILLFPLIWGLSGEILTMGSSSFNDYVSPTPNL